MKRVLRDHVAHARERLIAVGVPDVEAALDARVLAQHVLGWSTARYFSDLTTAIPADFEPDYERQVQRREQREPMAYILGHQDFWDLTFEVSPDVLIPRPETEGIIEATLELLSDREFPLSVADVCTGSGCLAITFAKEYSRARIVATDLSSDALEVAARNADRHDVSDRVRFVLSDVLHSVEGRFDLIVANPPYIPERERPSLQPEVRDYEPEMALFSGPAGMEIIEALVVQAPGHLVDSGLLLFEFGAGQEETVRRLVTASPALALVELRQDLQGIPRTAITRRKG